MELSDANLQTLTEYLKKTLDPDPAIRRPGKRLWRVTQKFGFLSALLSVCNKTSAEVHANLCRNSLPPSKKPTKKKNPKLNEELDINLFPVCFLSFFFLKFVLCFFKTGVLLTVKQDWLLLGRGF